MSPGCQSSPEIEPPLPPPSPLMETESPPPLSPSTETETPCASFFVAGEERVVASSSSTFASGDRNSNTVSGDWRPLQALVPIGSKY
ncbi:unnamed protein product [Cuscuta campestris]|uniref:Uncharacterized protein n=1 Tax=Cuscuta campestris TaxID=132261 RepID=A0A484L711_9ASTE|nr:unnamed protein product [Cuscuta campestris]